MANLSRLALRRKAKQALRVNGKFASATQWLAEQQLQAIARGEKRAIQPVLRKGTPKQRKQVKSILAKPIKLLVIPPVKEVEVYESYSESVENSTRLNKKSPGARYDSESGKYRRTVFGRVNVYRWDFKYMTQCQALLRALDEKYDSYRVPGTQNRVVARIEVWYDTDDKSLISGVSSPYDRIADTYLYTSSWEEKSSSQQMIARLDDRGKLVFTVELLLPDSAVEKFGEPDE